MFKHASILSVLMVIAVAGPMGWASTPSDAGGTTTGVLLQLICRAKQDL